MCNNEMPDKSLVGPWTIYQPNIHGTEEGGNIEVCGRCYLLTAILDTLKELKDEHN
jgi:hypothetical protein